MRSSTSTLLFLPQRTVEANPRAYIKRRSAGVCVDTICRGSRAARFLSEALNPYSLRSFNSPLPVSIENGTFQKNFPEQSEHETCTIGVYYYATSRRRSSALCVKQLNRTTVTSSIIRAQTVYKSSS